jgi:hypothetical protein
MVCEVNLGSSSKTSLVSYVSAFGPNEQPPGRTKRRFLCGSFFARPILLACLVVFPIPGSSQTKESPQAEQPQTAQVPNNSPHTEKKSYPVKFDPTAGGLVASPQAVETSQQTVEYAGMTGTPTGEGKTSKTSELVIAPFPISNPAIGSGIVVVGGYLFPISKADKASPSSMVGGGSFYTSNGSFVWGAGTKLYLHQDRFRIAGAYGQAQLQYDLYGIGNTAGNLGFSLPIKQGGKALLLESLVRVANKLFIGPRFQWRNLDARLSGERSPGVFNIDPVELKSTTASMGFHIQWDLRDSQFYPRTGTLTDVVGDFFQGNLGSDFSYQSYTFAFNKYSGLSPRQVLAFRVFGCATSGRVPFYDLCLMGVHNDIRGYKTGRYRDHLMLTTQAEYRLELPKRFGIAAFFGVGEVAPEVGSFNNENLKPAGGAGIRYTLAKKNHVNLRVDYAVGLQGGGVYMGVTEAF